MLQFWTKSSSFQVINILCWATDCDQTVHNNLLLSFRTRTISLDRNYREVINLLFALPILFYVNILKTEKMLQFRNRRRAWHVIPAQEVNTKRIFEVHLPLVIVRIVIISLTILCLIESVRSNLAFNVFPSLVALCKAYHGVHEDRLQAQ